MLGFWVFYQKKRLDSPGFNLGGSGFILVGSRFILVGHRLILGGSGLILVGSGFLLVGHRFTLEVNRFILVAASVSSRGSFQKIGLITRNDQAKKRERKREQA